MDETVKIPKTLKEWEERLHKIRVEAGRRGGLARVAKGFAKMPKYKVKWASRDGVKARREKNGNS